MDKLTPYDYIIQEEATYKTLRVPVTGSVDWNMHDHIERCTNVSKGWFHKGANDGTRPYKDIVSPIINVAIRSEGFDVKDIVPYVNDAKKYHKSFLVKKYHPKWARENELDTFIDEMVESSVIYDLALIKNVNSKRPEVTPLQTIAFCDQTSILSGPLALKHMMSISEVVAMKGKWDSDKVDEAITMAEAQKTVSSANDQVVKTPGKYMEIYELHGTLPNKWLIDKDATLDPDGWSPQIHIITYYTSTDGKRNGITLFKGAERKPIFKAVVLNPVFGRACGKSFVESLFEPQVWTNYSEIAMKNLLDAASSVFFHSDDEDLANQKLSKLKNNTVLKLGQGKSFGRTDTTAPNISYFKEHQASTERNARVLGSASEGALGISPSSGTPFKLQDLVVQEGKGIHEYRQGKLATFMADQLYRDWILKFLVDDMNGGKKFSEELSLKELAEIAEIITINEVERRISRMILATGKVPTDADRDMMRAKFKEDFLKGGSRRFFEILKGELDSVPVDVFVNIAGKQKNMARDADKLTNIVREVLKNPQGFKSVPGIGDLFNEIIENSGFSPINFAEITKPDEQPAVDPNAPVASPVAGASLPSKVPVA